MGGADSGPRSQEWETPWSLYRELEQRYAGGQFDLDAAARKQNARCEHYHNTIDDSLGLPWEGRVFVNPPYEGIGAWVEKAFEEVEVGRAQVVCMLLPARTDQPWFHDFVLPYAELEFIRGRVQFDKPPDVEKDSSNREPSMVAVFRRGLRAPSRRKKKAEAA